MTDIELSYINFSFNSPDTIWDIYAKVNNNFDTISSVISELEIPATAAIDGGDLEEP